MLVVIRRLGQIKHVDAAVPLSFPAELQGIRSIEAVSQL